MTIRKWQPVHIEPSWDYMPLPSNRPLWAILADIVAHGEIEGSTHGLDCSCMDKYSYELYAHILRALPETTKIKREDWDGTLFWDDTPESRERRQRAQWRIAGVLHMITRKL